MAFCDFTMDAIAPYRNAPETGDSGVVKVMNKVCRHSCATLEPRPFRDIPVLCLWEGVLVVAPRIAIRGGSRLLCCP